MLGQEVGQGGSEGVSLERSETDGRQAFEPMIVDGIEAKNAFD